MAWERRERGGSYYTRSVKRNGRVTREYIGTGETAALIARLDELDRAEREREQEQQRQERRRERELDSAIQEVEELTSTWALVALVAAGYHRHDRGEWRRRKV